MKLKDIEKAASSAVVENYGCNGEYPCTERNYCIFGNGQNTAFDCHECGADEFNDGFIAGAKWRINSVWHSMNEVQDGNRQRRDTQYSQSRLLFQQKPQVLCIKGGLTLRICCLMMRRIKSNLRAF